MRVRDLRDRARSTARAAAATWLVVALLGMTGTRALAAGTFYVDTQHPDASDSNPGTEALPHKTITGAAAAHSGAGTVLIVKPGTYRETVTVPASGSPNDHFIFQASGPGVVVDGSDDFSGPSKWALHSGTVYRAASVTWNPRQVFVDGDRLTPAAVAPELLPPNSFVYTTDPGGGLYVNLGGASPGSRATLVGRRLYAFRLSGKSHVTIQGFTVVRAEDRAFHVHGGSHSVVLRSNTVTHAYKYGIALSRGTGVLVEHNIVGHNQDHGIVLADTSTACTVQDNESFHNAHPTIRQSNGIYVSRSPDNLIQRNRIHHNQDTGLQLTLLSHDNRAIQNLSWMNGDHGFDVLNSMNTTILGCVAYRNYKNGFSIEGSSSGTRLHNSIATDNGIAVLPGDGALEPDLWVDLQSSAGFVSDHNIFWNSTSQAPVKYIHTSYTSVAAYSAASGQDAHTLQLDPRFADPANGDFELLPSSPAIDAAHSGVAGWPALDGLGRARVDAPAIANTGVGGIVFADRGALEHQTDQAPVVTVQPAVSVSQGEPLSLEVNASDPDGGAIGSLVAEGLPAGATFTPGPGNYAGTLQWTPTPAQVGGHLVTFTASNAFSGSASTTITVTAVAGAEPAGIPLRPVLAPSPLRSRATLSFHLPVAGFLEVSLHDLTGRCVRRVVRRSDSPAGVHRLSIDGRSDTGELLSSGVYFYSIRTSQGVRSGRMVIAR